MNSHIQQLYRQYKDAEAKVTSQWADSQRGRKAWASRRYNQLTKAIEAEGLNVPQTLCNLAKHD